MTLFPDKVTLTGTGLGLQRAFFGDTIQPMELHDCAATLTAVSCGNQNIRPTRGVER